MCEITLQLHNIVYLLNSFSGLPLLMASCTGMLSTTDQVSPAASIASRRARTSSAGHTSPMGMWCSAVTIPVAPA